MVKGPVPGFLFHDTLKDGSKGPEMVVIPKGKFRMGDLQRGGDEAENLVQDVTINRPFALSKYPITFADYDRYAKAAGVNKPGDKGWGRENRPVINVSWKEAVAYAQWLSEQTGKDYRLPSEAEWEYAARAGTETAYWWGNEIGTNHASCDGCGSQWDNQMTSPVDSFKANPFGLHDMSGNVWEWVQDCWNDNYKNAPDDGTAWETGECALRVVRGGSWLNLPWYVRSANRYGGGADDRYLYLGFRLAQDL